ncbi:MAG: D-aminoacyl-tRNA deacylase [Bacteroidota bacterium]|nr:D-aminoacyl-tRNA deacylase [Bacteroidota bacterium]
MRAVVQRVLKASVNIKQEIHSQIGCGLLVFLAVSETDTHEDLIWICKKIANLRIFNDKLGKMNLSLTEVGAELLLVSQFTLYASTVKGNRPSFLTSAKPEKAEPLFQHAVKELETLLGIKIQTGVFGADMQIQIMNDGPVTIIIDSQLKE